MPSLIVSLDDQRVEIDVGTDLCRGHLSARAARYLEEWMRLRGEDIRRNVERLRRGEAARAIEPLG